jgi:MSHA biogenesis protein MshG
MPLYAYQARDANGAAIQGRLEATDPGTLADALAGQGLTLVRAQAGHADSAPVGLDRWLQSRAIGTEDMLLFCRQISTLLKAGVPILRALRGLEESASNPRFGQVLGNLQQQLEGGHELSLAMQREGRTFSPYMVSMVRVGEVTGRLPEVFQGLHEHFAFERESREQVGAALRYPIFVISVAAAALIAVNIFVIPAFARVYEGMHAELPWFTRMLIGFSNFTRAWWLPMLAGLAVAAVALARALRTVRGQTVRDGLILRLPIFGSLVHKAALARFSKSFGLAMGSGVPLVDALGVALETADNRVLAERIGQMRPACERGESMVRAARATGAFTPAVLQMVAVGEETGALGEMMEEIAGFYQKEVEFAVRGLAAQIEPILILVLGVMVLVIALGVFLPMWDLSHVVLKH